MIVNMTKLTVLLKEFIIELLFFNTVYAINTET